MGASAIDARLNSMSETNNPTELRSPHTEKRADVTGASATNKTTEQVAVGKKGIEVPYELGGIVLVNKGLMEDWRKMQETLRTEMEKQQDIVDSSLRAENFSFIQRNNQMEKAMTEELNVLNRRYEHLQMEEAEQKDEN